jgi:hypothetical protein
MPSLRSLFVVFALIMQSWASPTQGAASDLGESGECEPFWATDEFCPVGLNGEVASSVVWDDGSGPALYVGGGFTFAGCTETLRIAKWDGQEWAPLGSGLQGGTFPSVSALAVFDDGTGPALFVGGFFTIAGGVTVNNIAKWDGVAWSPLAVGSEVGISGAVEALLSHQGALYAAGSFTDAGGVFATNIARWNGTMWSPVGTGLNGRVIGLVEHVEPGSPTPRLFATGEFTTAGGQPAARIARWNGSQWSSLGSGLNGAGRAVFSTNDGSGPALYVGGDFTTAGGLAALRIARWRNGVWSALGDGLNDTVNSIFAYDLGFGTRVLAGGRFGDFDDPAKVPTTLAEWNGFSWTTVEDDTNQRNFEGGAVVETLTSFDDGAGGGPRLIAGGFFGAFGSIISIGADRWATLGGAFDDRIAAIETFDFGDGDALYLGGDFSRAGGVSASRIGRYKNGEWSSLGSGIIDGTVQALLGATSVDGPSVYAGGRFLEADGLINSVSIARWDGTAWSQLGNNEPGGSIAVNAMIEHNDGTGPAIYIASERTVSSSTFEAVRRWDGASWSIVGTGNGLRVARNLAVFDDGSGAALYVSGGNDFSNPLGSEIKRWDGSSWSSIGGVPTGSGSINALAIYDDGTGPALYAAGSFTTIGGIPARYLARWDGQQWAEAGGGTQNTVSDLLVFDDGRGARLFATGIFTTAGNQPAARIASWDGAEWEALGSGFGGSGRTLGALATAHERAVFVSGGIFGLGPTQFSPPRELARWNLCLDTVTPCEGDTNGDNIVNFTDLNQVLSSFGQSGAPGTIAGDVNGDGVVNFTDLNEVLSNFGVSCI